MAAGTVSPMFGWVFKKGDIPSGTAPVFDVSGTPQPYSWGLQTYWTDGSLKFASFFFRSTFSLAASATQDITIKNGGSAPSSSSRSLATDVYSQSIIVNITAANNSGTPISPANLTGTIKAWLDSAANTNNNNWQQSLIHDGDAGRTWKVRCHMSATKTGSADGQFETDFYVAALTDGSGNLGGIRLLPSVVRPWYNSTSGSANLVCIQPDCSFQYGAGPTTVDMVTAGTMPFTNKVFTVSGGVASTTASNNFYQGADSTSNYVPCYVKNSGGALPSPLAANTLYYVGSNQSGGATNVVTFYSVPGYYGGPITLTTNGSGTNTIVPVSAINQYEPFPMPTTGGRWNEFQGTGSGNTGASTSLRVKIDQTYWHSTKCIPPFDLSLIGTVTDDGWTYDFTPVNVGPYQWSGGTGERAELGIMPNNHVVEFFTRSAAADKEMRVSGYSANHQLLHIRDAPVAFAGGGTGQIPNFNNASYTGMPSLVTGASIIYYPGSPSNGINAPTDYFATEDAGTDHKPCPSIWPYLRTGEPQFLDCMIDVMVGAVGQFPQDGATTRNPTTPYAAYGLVTQYTSQMRVMAWANRDLQWAAAFCPGANGTGLFYDGSQLPVNLNDIATANCKWPSDMMSNAGYDNYGNACSFHATISGTTLTMVSLEHGLLLKGQVITTGASAGTTIVSQLTGTAGGAAAATFQVSISQTVGSSTAMVSSSTSYVQAHGFWVPVNQDIGGAATFIQGFMLGYMLYSMCVAAAAREDAYALSWLQTQSTRYNYMLSQFGGWTMYDLAGNGSTSGPYPSGSSISWPVISDDTQFGIAPDVGPPGPFGSMTWNNTGPTYFAFTSTNQSGSGYVPTNNDRFYNTGATVPAVLKSYTAYYAGDVSGNNLNLYTAPNGGGTKLVPSNTGAVVTPKALFLSPANPPAASTADYPTFGPTDAQGETALMDGAFSYMTACGVTGMSTVTTDSRTRRDNSGAYTNYAALPKYAMQTSF
jgi:hypothetical protein